MCGGVVACAFIYTKTNISRDFRFSLAINSSWTFTYTNPGIKKDHIPNIIIFSIKTTS